MSNMHYILPVCPAVVAKLPGGLSPAGLQPDLSHWKCFSTLKNVSVKTSIVWFHVYGLLMMQYQVWFILPVKTVLGHRFFWCSFPLPWLLIREMMMKAFLYGIAFSRGFHSPDPQVRSLQSFCSSFIFIFIRRIWTSPHSGHSSSSDGAVEMLHVCHSQLPQQDEQQIKPIPF